MKLKKKYKNTYTTKIPDLNNQVFIPDGTLDFHEFGVLDKFDIEKLLSEFIEDSYVKGLKRVLIIVGKGLIVRPEVEKLLKENSFVENFKRAGYFNGQDGAFEVNLKQ
jgi:DNA-nicking Smr family endonuclease